MSFSRFTNYLLKHQLQTLLLVFFITFIPLVGVLGILIATLVTLRKSIVQGAILTLVTSIAYFISMFYIASNQAIPTMVVYGGIGIALLSNVVTWGVAVMLRKGNSWSVILQLSTLLGVLAVSVIHLGYPHIVDWWGNELNHLQSDYAQMLITLKQNSQISSQQVESTVQFIEKFKNVIKQFATGLMVTDILLIALTQLVVARWWQAKVYEPKLLKKELQQIRLSPLAGTLFILSFSIGFFNLENGVLLDIKPILYMLFCAAGLSLLHYLFNFLAPTSAWLGLLIFYIVLIYLMMNGIPVMGLLVILALLDIWLDLRKRVQKV